MFCLLHHQKKIVDRIYRRLKIIGRRLHGFSVRLARSKNWWVKVHYWAADSSFRREQQAVIAGQAKFAAEEGCPRTTSSLLRRSIHRIEKGLISRPRKPVFAIDYIEPVVDVYARMLRGPESANRVELAWAHDVLNAYFEVCEDSPSIRNAREKFQRLEEIDSRIPPDRALTRAPYTRKSPQSTVGYDSFLQLAKQRRSVRWFEQRPVPREDLLKALSVATLSPSACNRQPFTFRIFDKEPFLSMATSLPPGTRGYEHQFPCVIAVVGHQRYYSLERDRHLIYIDGSLATMSLILALETLGLSSCCINWPDIEERELAAEKALKLEPDERIVMFIAVGYADPEGSVPYSEKRTPEELCRFNFE